MRPSTTGPARDPGTGRVVLRRAVELGVNHIDTAFFYACDDGAVSANALVREALHAYPAGLVLAPTPSCRRPAKRPASPGAHLAEDLAAGSITSRRRIAPISHDQNRRVARYVPISPMPSPRPQPALW
jgi:aryl-alcohol dehydrogenase-like predicted oxidoreductase